MELQWIMPAPLLDTGRKISSCFILVDRLTLPKVAVRGILGVCQYVLLINVEL